MNERMYYSHEAAQRAQRERLIIAFFSMVVGAGVAALLALIYAPQRGEETRHELGQHLGQAMTQGRKTANHVAHDVRENADRLREDVEERLEAARQ